MIDSKLQSSLVKKTSSWFRVGVLFSIFFSSFLTTNSLVYARQASLENNGFISRNEAANPNNFQFLLVNGKSATAAIEPCLVDEGLLTCALKKSDIVSGGVSSLDDEYDLAQAFIFNRHHKTKKTTAVVVLTKTGVQDDSILAERLRISFKLTYQHPNQGTWQLVQYGTQVQCARGKQAGQWIKVACP